MSAEEYRIAKRDQARNPISHGRDVRPLGSLFDLLNPDLYLTDLAWINLLAWPWTNGSSAKARSWEISYDFCRFL